MARECGGCALIGRPYEEQLRFRTDRVRETFADHPTLASLTIEDCLPAPARVGYRNRAKLAVAHDGRGVRIGLYRRGSNTLVDLAPCRVQRPLLQEGLEVLRGWLSEHRLARPRGPVIYVDLRESAARRCHVTLVLDGARRPPTALALESLRQVWPAISGIAVNRGDARSSYPIGTLTRNLLGEPTIRARVPGHAGQDLVFEVPPSGFFQVATSALAAVHERMFEHLGPAGTLYDLYCGVGVHGLALASRSAAEAGAKGTAETIGVEASESLIEAARRNAARMHVAASYFADRVERILPDLSRGHAPVRVVLNPGRAGCRPEALEALHGCAAPRAAYLSCNVSTLARDLVRLVAGGYRVERVLPVDLMPQTDHVEVLALLAR